jgi:antitoxin MazE
MTTITTKLVNDGNSKAVRIPKAALEMSGIKGALVLNVKKGEITIKNASKPRAGWEEALKKDKKALDSTLNEWEGLGGDGTDEY